MPHQLKTEENVHTLDTWKHDWLVFVIMTT